MTTPGRIRGFLWPTEFLVFSDFLQAAPHAHSALQLHVGLDGAPRVQLDQEWRDARAALIDTDTVHAFDCAGAMTAIGWVEGESRVGRDLRDVVLQGRPYAILDDATCARLAGTIGPALTDGGPCDHAHGRWRGTLAQFGVDVGTDMVDERIAAVLDHLRRTPSPPPTVDDLCAIAFLSESHLQHVFREQVGVPIRRYLLWHRYMTAMSLLADGLSATEAAHGAGFADSAHLTRTAVRMNGFTPTKMPFRHWLANCR